MLDVCTLNTNYFACTLCLATWAVNSSRFQHWTASIAYSYAGVICTYACWYLVNAIQTSHYRRTIRGRNSLLFIFTKGTNLVIRFDPATERETLTLRDPSSTARAPMSAAASGTCWTGNQLRSDSFGRRQTYRGCIDGQRKQKGYYCDRDLHCYEWFCWRKGSQWEEDDDGYQTSVHENMGFNTLN